MAAGGRINSVYAKHGSNTGASVFLAIGDQNAATVINELKSSSGEAPLFPVVGGDGGSGPLWQDYSFEKFGTSFLIHLTKRYEELPISGADGYGIDIGLTKADTCCKTAAIPPGNTRVNGFSVLSAAGTRISFTVTKAGMHAISLYSTNGRHAGSKHVNCFAGTASADFAIAASGTYVVCVSGASGETFGRCVFSGK